MAVLTAKTRNALPSKDFAGPDRSYPIEDRAHAQNALARVSQYGTPAEKARVRAAVDKKYHFNAADQNRKAGALRRRAARGS